MPFTISLSPAVTSDMALGLAFEVGDTSPCHRGDRPGDPTDHSNDSRNQARATFTAPITNDAIVEGDETFD